jgi:hypothetical protein
MRLYSLLLLTLVLTGCTDLPIIGNVPLEDSINDFTVDSLPQGVAKLETLNISTVENFEKYRTLADNTNNLIRILNEKEMFNIPELEPSFEGWQKASRYITEYGPLIDNYNDVVTKAKIYTENSSEKRLEDFYFAAGAFGFETALIAGAVFYSAAFQGVGYAYRAAGLNSLAFKCGSCVSIILSNAHWFVRTTLVEGTSQLAQRVTDYARENFDNNGG